MDDMISRISSILDDSEQVEKIKQIAASMMGNNDDKNTEQGEVSTENIPKVETTPAISGDTVSRSQSYARIFSSINCTKNISLLNAIRPYMRSSRAEKIGSAIKAMEMIELLSKIK